MDYDNILNILEDIKHIETLGDTGLMTLGMVAEYFEVERSTMDMLISRNNEELKSNGLVVLKGKEIREIFEYNNIINYRGYFVYNNIKFANGNNTLINNKSLVKISLMLNDSPISVELKRRIGLSTKITPRKEILFLEQLVESLKPFGIIGEKQYSVLSYKIDYYISSLNIAIEYDENEHDGYTYEQHDGRQKDIEEELGCKFIRVSDKNSNEYNIGYVIKNIFNI